MKISLCVCQCPCSRLLFNERPLLLIVGILKPVVRNKKGPNICSLKMKRAFSVLKIPLLPALESLLIAHISVMQDDVLQFYISLISQTAGSYRHWIKLPLQRASAFASASQNPTVIWRAPFSLRSLLLRAIQNDFYYIKYLFSRILQETVCKTLRTSAFRLQGRKL